MLFGCILLVLLGSVVVRAYYTEKRTWNNGICKSNGIKWKCFDMDSTGARGYKAGEEYIWISYWFDK